MCNATIYLKSGDCFTVKNYGYSNDVFAGSSIAFLDANEKPHLAVSISEFSHMIIDYKEAE